jgi:hypothetical protein
MSSAVESLAPIELSKISLCGYSWGDLGNALNRAISSGDMHRAQRWGAEFACSEGGLGRLEAILFHAWAIHVGPLQAPGWPLAWLKSIQHIRMMWGKSGGDIRTVRNTPSVRQSVAEAVAWLVLAVKKPLPKMPKPEDCYRESEAMRSRLRAGGGAGDQLATRRIWCEKGDGHDLKTIGNELEAALRGNLRDRLLFWIVWLATLDTQKDCPSIKERAPAQITSKSQRKSVLWFLSALIEDILHELRVFTETDERAIFDLLGTTWTKLGSKGRRDVLTALAISAQERVAKALVFAPHPPPPHAGIRSAMSEIDKIYAEIANEARRFLAEMPTITGLTPESAAAASEAARMQHLKRSLPTSLDKIAMAYSAAIPGTTKK